MILLPPVGRLGGRTRAMLRFLQRRGPQTREALLVRFVDGKPAWFPEDVDRAVSELVEHGYATGPDEDGFVQLVLKWPL